MNGEETYDAAAAALLVRPEEVAEAEADPDIMEDEADITELEAAAPAPPTARVEDWTAVVDMMEEVVVPCSTVK
jgi:hypothetical protein